MRIGYGAGPGHEQVHVDRADVANIESHGLGARRKGHGDTQQDSKNQSSEFRGVLEGNDARDEDEATHRGGSFLVSSERCPPRSAYS